MKAALPLPSAPHSTLAGSPLLANDAAVSHPTGIGLRDLLRDTALEVTTLSGGGKTANGPDLRTHCLKLISDFHAALDLLGLPADVRQEIAIAQCGLLDETALRHLPAEQKAAWEAAPLQVELFEQHDAGERVFDRLGERMREAAPHVELLQFYAAILGLGFIGRYAREGETKLTALKAALAAKLEQLSPATAPTFVIDRPKLRLADRLSALSPWGLAGLACLAAALLWLVCSAALDAQLAHLASQAARP
ncbi:DotU family type IV/VI secretion system protein [Ralstonia sp. 25C]|uniref:DotU family type IV/VI secretion system protein n=1 Tax=Ralstonia sp. 25C TaxID=3447363 RepID=UPI003F753DB0